MSRISNWTLPIKQHSFWFDTARHDRYQALKGELEFDVAVVGGGIAGITTAYVLKQAGYNVAVIEKHTLSSGTTGGTTGKVTTQQGIFYSDLIARFGLKKAKVYASAYQQAFDDMSKLINTKKIDCDWAIEKNTVFTTESTEISRFKRETQAAKSLGFPAELETILPLPFDIKAAVSFYGQGRFNASKYVHELAKYINSGSSRVFEHSQVKSFTDGDECRVTTNQGHVRAKHIVIATKIPPYPLAARFTYGIIAYPTTSYVVMGTYDGDLEGMYISPDDSHYSITSLAIESKKYLLIAGESHIPGLGRPRARHKKLANYASEHFGVDKISWRWKSMDYIAYDRLPIMGLLYPWSKRTYAISGFKKWGLVSSMVAANVVRDVINSGESEMANLCTPHRLSAPLSIPRTISNSLL
jgi:glycine/D-amino acid oxidase-like deaminating enzyme